ncbi:RidA family protein [Pseudomonas orientalis]|uniref:RidA family protein n=2 Tax=Pseudomonas TaxID=286 RepID=UPI0034D3B462
MANLKITWPRTLIHKLPITHALIFGLTHMPSANIERKNYPALPPAVGPYSHSVKNGHTLYLSGFTAFGTEAQGQSLEKQANAILQQIKTVAVEEGTDMSALLKVTIFITDFSQAGELRKVLAQHYDGHLPASSLVEVSKLFSPELNIEIEAIFAI